MRGLIPNHQGMTHQIPHATKTPASTSAFAIRPASQGSNPSYTVNMLETHGDDHGFAPEEQTEILMMAARLQEEQRDRLSADQLERLGQEAGIDPIFVRLAIERRKATPQDIQPVKHKPKAVAFGFQAIVTCFLGLETYALIQIMLGSGRNLFEIFLPLAAALCLGHVIPKEPKRRDRFLRFLAVTTVAIGVAIGLLAKVTTGSINSWWYPALPIFLASIGLAIWSGGKLESWLGAIRSRFGPEPSPNV